MNISIGRWHRSLENGSLQVRDKICLVSNWRKRLFMEDVASVHLTPGNRSLIDEFCDTVWLEDGLSRNTLEAYRSDLQLFAQWLEKNGAAHDLLAVTPEHLNRYFLARHAESKATSANRRLTVFKRFYRLQIRMGRLAVSPCQRMRAAKQPARFPHALSERQVEALLSAPDVQKPLGLRDRTMIELMYCCAETGRNGNERRCVAYTGQGQQNPAGSVRRRGKRMAGTLFAGKPSRDFIRKAVRSSVRHGARNRDDPANVLDADKKICRAIRHS